MENLGFSQKPSGFSLTLCSRLGKPLLIMFGFHLCSLLWVSSLECSTIYQHDLFFGLETTNGVIIEPYTVTKPIQAITIQVQEIVIYQLLS